MMIKKVLSTVLLFAILSIYWPGYASVSVSPLALNRNPSFESSEDHSWRIPEWLPTQNAQKPIFDSNIAVEGAQSIRFDIEPGKTLLYLQSFGLHPGVKKYRVSGWIKQQNVRGTTPDIRLEQVAMVNSKEQYRSFPAHPTGRRENDFVEYAAVVPVEPGVFAIRLQLFAPRAGTDAAGQVWFDAVTLSKHTDTNDKMAVELVRPGGDHGIHIQGNPQKISAVITNGTKQDQSPEVTFRISDHTGKTVYEFHKSHPLAVGETVEIFNEITPILADCGLYHIEISAQIPDSPAARGAGTMVVTGKKDKRDPFFGFTSYGAPDRIMAAMASLGAGTCGYVIYVTEQNPQGTFQFDRHTAALALRRKLGYRIVGGYNIQGSSHIRPAWLNAIAKRDLESGATGYSEEYFKAYRDFARAFGTYMRDKVDEFSLIEEIDIAQHLTKFEHDSYIRISRESALELKQAAPGLPVSGVGVASPDFNANPPLQAMKHFWSKLSGDLDSIGFDGYITPNCFGEGRVAGTPESNHYREKLQAVAKLSREAGKSHFSIEEAGWSMVSTTPPNSQAWLDYAAILQRTLILSKTVPEMKHYLYFKVIDGNRLEDWNLFTDNGTMPTAGAAAFGVVAHNLAFADHPEAVELHQSIQLYLFDQDGRTLVTLWSTVPSGTRFRLELPAPAEISDFMGKRQTLPAGTVDIYLSGQPLYLWSNVDRNILRQSLRKAEFSLPELKFDAVRTGRNEVTVTLLNLTDTSLKAQLTNEQQTIGLVLQPHGKASAVLTGIDVGQAEIPFRVTTERHQYSWKKMLTAHPVGSADNPAIIRLDGAENLEPVDAMANQLWTGSEDLSAQIQLSSDRKALYLQVDVRDDVKIRERSGARLWSSDSIQFAINPDGDALIPDLAGQSGYGARDWEFGMALTPEGPQLYCYRAPAASGWNARLIPPTAIHYSISELNASVTRYEVVLPWQLLGMAGEPGNVFGFNLIALDSDVSGQSCNYWMGITAGIANGKRPDLFRRFILEP